MELLNCKAMTLASVEVIAFQCSWSDKHRQGHETLAEKHSAIFNMRAKTGCFKRIGMIQLAGQSVSLFC